MIRTLILILGVVLTSCHKDSVDLGPDYDRLVGKWENIEGDDRIHIEVWENGKINITKSTERSEKYKLKKITMKPNGVNINGFIWDYFNCYELDRNQNISNGISFAINSSNDTIFLSGTGTPVNNFVASGYFSLFKRIE